MILFLIEIYLLGCGIAVHFRNKLPDFFLSLIAVFFGLLGYFINLVVLTFFNIHVTINLLAILIGLEILLLFGARYFKVRRDFFNIKSSLLFFLISGLGFIASCWYFFVNGWVFYSPDSMYMVIMAKSLLETGFSEWYFASPLLWGIFVPAMQTIGMLFEYEYTWFIQPVISIVFLASFLYLLIRAGRKESDKKWMPIILAVLGGLIMISANMYWAAQFYIHTNLNSGISLFFVVVSLFMAVREDNKSWLGITALFLIMFGMLRTENVIVASLVIVLAVVSNRLSYRERLLTFLPYLGVQILWNLFILRIKPEAFSNLMTTDQLLVVTIALILLVVFLMVSDNKWLKEKLFPKMPAIFVSGILLTILLVVILRRQAIFIFILNNLTTLFLTGQWLTTFWVVITFLVLVRPKTKLDFDSIFKLTIIGFFAMIVMMGALKGSHAGWWDSANRMYIHILPVMVFYLILRLNIHFSELKIEQSTNE